MNVGKKYDAVDQNTFLLFSWKMREIRKKPVITAGTMTKR
jgi:hypothetical protein